MLQDVRYAARMLRRAPGFAALAIATVALGIGVTTSIFAVVTGVLVRPLPYAQPEQLVIIRADSAGAPRSPSLSGPEVEDVRAASDLIAGVATVVPVEASVRVADGFERVPAISASDNLFAVLGVPMFLGRPLDRRLDTGVDRVTGILISHEIWQQRFNGDPTIVGSTIDANNLQVTVVGIVPPGFTLHAGADAGFPQRVDVWFPGSPEGGRGDRGYRVIARLRSGITLEAARAGLAAVAARANSQHPNAYGTLPLRIYVERLQDDAVREWRAGLAALMGAVTFVLLIACANIANLLLTRTAARQREIAVRSALGAARNRLLRQLVTEGLLLGVAGGAAGVLLAAWTENLLAWLRPSSMPRVAASATDGGVLLFAFGTTVLASLLFSVLPALRGTRLNLSDALKAGSRSETDPRSRLRSALVAVEVGLCAVLLVGAGLMLRTLAKMTAVDVGFSPARVLTLQTSMRPREFAAFERKWQFYGSALDRVRSLPGVDRVSGIAPLPLTGRTIAETFAVDAGTSGLAGSAHTVLPDYFGTLGIPLVAGRDFTRQDIDTRAPVAVVDEHFARQAWPGTTALGRRIRQSRSKADRWLEVVGVARHVRESSLRAEGLPQVYLPYHERALFDLALVVRSPTDPLPLAPLIRREIHALGGRRPVHSIRMMEDYVRDATADSRYALALLGSFALLALTLSAVGIYGVVAYATMQRTREIGVRVALGARPSQIRRLVVGQGLTWTIAGIVAGLAGAALLTRYVETLVFGVSTSDPLTLAGVTLLLLAIAALASYAPARRALRVDPIAALRNE